MNNAKLLSYKHAVTLRVLYIRLLVLNIDTDVQQVEIVATCVLHDAMLKVICFHTGLLENVYVIFKVPQFKLYWILLCFTKNSFQ
jgi:hypothetical protein